MLEPLEESYSRRADVSDGHAGNVLALVIDETEVDQAVDVKARFLELLLLEGRIEALVKHGLKAVEAGGAGSP